MSYLPRLLHRIFKRAAPGRIGLADTCTLDTVPERYADAPIGLQLVCRCFEDEKVIGVYEYLDSLAVFKK